MDLRTYSVYLGFIALACVATWWVVWPGKYVACLEAAKRKLRRTPAMRAGLDRVEAVSPLSSSKPWYPGLLRITGILIWAALVCIAYIAHGF